MADTEVISNGSVVDSKTKKIVKGPRMSSEQARALVKKRWDAYREATEEGLMKATRHSTPVAAYSRLVEKLAEVALDTDSPKQVAAYKAIREGLLGSDVPREEEVPQGGMVFKADGAALRDLVEALKLARDMRSSDAIDADFVEPAKIS